MRSASPPTDALSHPPDEPRLFVVFTRFEAAALLRQRPSASRTAALAKIRTALTHATTAPGVAPKLRMAKAAIRKAPIGLPPETRASSPARDDYVPYRDEAGGIYT